MLVNRHGLRRRLARGYAYDLARRLTEEMLVDCGRERFYVATSDAGVGRELFISKHFDAESFERTFLFLARHGCALEGRIFLDVGANIGTTSIMAMTRLGCSHVYSFEPNETNVRMLRQNILVNGLEGIITPVPVAISDVRGEVSLRLCDSNSGDHRVLGRGKSGTDGRSVVTVPAMRLDDWLAENEIQCAALGVLWIDAQGHEPWILAGASRVLASSTPVICEFWPHGLQESGGLDLMITVLAGSGRQVIDLGPPAQAQKPRALARADLPALADRYPGTNNFCDLLLLPPGISSPA